MVLLSEVFKTSIDNLIKGDNWKYERKINEQEIKKFNYYGNIFTVHLVITLLSAVPLFFWLERLAFIPFGILFVITMYWALKVEKVKKDNDIQTYKEIVAFSEGKRLDEIQKQREIGKRPYQNVLKMNCSCNCCNRSMFFDWTIVSFAWKLDTCFGIIGIGRDCEISGFWRVWKHAFTLTTAFRYQDGKVQVNHNHFLGYTKDEERKTGKETVGGWLYL